MELAFLTEQLSIVFDSSTGKLIEIRNTVLNDTVVRPAPESGSVLSLRLDDMQTVPLSLLSARSRRPLMELAWSGGGLECLLTIRAGSNPSSSLWDLLIRNTGPEERLVSPEFPLLRGVMPEPPGDNARGFVQDQFGHDAFAPAVRSVLPLQWHCLIDAGRGSVLGIQARDPHFLPKSIRTADHEVSLSYTGSFPVGRGAILRLPQIVIGAHSGDWRGTAADYREWLRRRLPQKRPPRWFFSGAVWGAALSETEISPGPGQRGAAFKLCAGPEDEAGCKRAHGFLSRDPALPVLQIRASYPHRRPVLSGGGSALCASLSGVPWLSASPTEPAEDAERWYCAQITAWDALVWGEPRRDPAVDDPGISTRLFEGWQFSAVVAARRDADSGGLTEYHAPYRLLIPWSGTSAPDVAACDLETLAWRTIVPFPSGGCFGVDESANWVLVVVLNGKTDLVGFDRLPEVIPGGVLSMNPRIIAGPGTTARIRLSIPGCLEKDARIVVGEESRLPIPKTVRPGRYPVILHGRGALRFCRMLRVLGA